MPGLHRPFRGTRSARGALEAAKRGGGRLALLIGESGVGKSRLAAEVARRAGALGMETLWGGCSQADLGAPYLPLVEAAGKYMERAELGRLSSELGAACGELAVVFPQLGCQPMPFGPFDEPGLAQLRLFESVLSLLKIAAGPGGLLLVIEDLHWADSSTAEIVDYLARRVRSSRILLLVTCRGRSGSPPAAPHPGGQRAAHRDMLESERQRRHAAARAAERSTPMRKRRPSTTAFSPTLPTFGNAAWCCPGWGKPVAGDPWGCASGLRHLEEGVKALEEAGDPLSAAEFRISLSTCQWQVGRRAEAQLSLKRALAVLEPAGASPARLQRLTPGLPGTLPSPAHGRRLCRRRRAVHVAGQVGSNAARIWALQWLGFGLAQLGHVEGLGHLDRSYREAAEHRLPLLAVRAICNGLVIRLRDLRLGEAVALLPALEAIDIGSAALPIRSVNQSAALLAAGDAESALAYAEEGLRMAEETGSSLWTANASLAVAAALADHGRLEGHRNAEQACRRHRLGVAPQIRPPPYPPRARYGL